MARVRGKRNSAHPSFDRDHGAARPRRASSAPPQEGAPTVKTILVTTDLSARSDRAMLRAARLAVQHGATLRVLHVCDDDLPAALLSTRCDEAEHVLRAMVDETPVLSAAAPEVEVEPGHLTALVPKVAAEIGAGLVVLGSHRGRGLSELLGKPSLIRLMRGLSVPLLVVAGRTEAPYGAVSVGWDFSPAAEAAARLAAEVAPEAEMTLVHAWMDTMGTGPFGGEVGIVLPRDEEARLRSEIARAAAELRLGGRTVAAEVAIGPPASVLRHRAEAGHADLLAIGRHARSGLATFLLGATAEDVALTAQSDVLVTPPM
jgi:nucleotide-binding universal stress UspA family protein